MTLTSKRVIEKASFSQLRYLKFNSSLTVGQNGASSYFGVVPSRQLIFLFPMWIQLIPEAKLEVKLNLYICDNIVIIKFPFPDEYVKALAI